MKEIENILVFDVESTNLHGNGFAVGAVVINKESGKEIDTFELKSKEGEEWACDWVKENVTPNIKDMPSCDTSRELRDAFYEFYMKYKNTSEIWSDCNFPVETNFLSQIVKDDMEARQWNMPYPLKDISTIIDISIDRVADCGIDGLRKHHPLDDARASLWWLLEYLKQ